MKDVEILKIDGCTEKEAERLLKKGTQVWESPDQWIENLKESGCYEGQTVDMLNKVDFQGKTYYIEYAN